MMMMMMVITMKRRMLMMMMMVMMMVMTKINRFCGFSFDSFVHLVAACAKLPKFLKKEDETNILDISKKRSHQKKLNHILNTRLREGML